MASKPSENLVKTKMLHETSTKSSQNLRKIHEMPRHLRFNKYVLTHYRPPSDSIGCLKSLFYLHNETVNILTHGIPVVVILASIPWLLPWDELKVPYLPSFHVVASIAPWIGSTIYHLFMNHNTVFTVVDLTAPGLTGCTNNTNGSIWHQYYFDITFFFQLLMCPRSLQKWGFQMLIIFFHFLSFNFKIHNWCSKNGPWIV